MSYQRLKSEQKNILIIDNIADNEQILSSILKNVGYNVRLALNWQMVFTACQTMLPDIILLEIMMLEVDGYEICRRLKASATTTDIPVIFISALDDIFDKVKAFEVGAVDYITKPFEIEEVLVRVQNQLRFRAAQLEILKLKAELEQMVFHRTSELEATLETLYSEIRERKQLQNKLLEITLYDSLTGLPNRVFFIQRLEKALNRASLEPNYQFAVLFLDCDRFKVVNDSLGHFVGDELLKSIASRLQETLTSVDILARLGGDEFAIFLDNLTDINSAIQTAKRILQKLSISFHLSRYDVFINASIGIILGNFSYEKPEYLLRDADTAMYHAKALGRARYHVFTPEMHQKALQLLELENDLRRAIERKEFTVHYQPIISLSTGKIAGFEALVRWLHPSKGLIYPREFIPVAEEIGLINHIDILVLQSACHHLHLWQNHFANQNITISVNLSARLFSHSNFMTIIDNIIYENEINPANLEIEITESVIMENSEDVLTILQQLQLRKIKLIMDDFGTGYSSLSYLHSFPLNSLKIDQCFVRRMLENKENIGLVSAMISIAHSMGMTAIAEGVETCEQLAQLKSLNCNSAQGYLFSRPLEQELVLDLIAEAPQW